MLRPLAIVVALGTVACSDGFAPPRQLLPASASPNLVVYASNQSFDIDPVDIRIALDSELLVTGDFLVEGQHSWHRFDFEIPKGPRELTVSSSEAPTQTRTVTIGADTLFVVVDFWYYPPSHYEPFGPEFTIQELAQEPVFQ